MLEIKKAAVEQADEISNITKAAFDIYRGALDAATEVRLTALTESVADVRRDIEQNTVFTACENDKIIGAIRVKALSNDLAYIYRFAVDPCESSGGVGSELLAAAVNHCAEHGFSAVTLHTNSKYYKLARYYYGKQFYVHSTDMSKGYIRALFVKDLNGKPVDLSPAKRK